VSLEKEIMLRQGQKYFYYRFIYILLIYNAAWRAQVQLGHEVRIYYLGSRSGLRLLLPFPKNPGEKAGRQPAIRLPPY
jgi:hypothetical protein